MDAVIGRNAMVNILNEEEFAKIKKLKRLHVARLGHRICACGLCRCIITIESKNKEIKKLRDQIEESEKQVRWRNAAESTGRYG